MLFALTLSFATSARAVLHRQLLRRSCDAWFIPSVQVLRPLAPFACPEAEAAYPPLPAGEQVQRELAAINLKLC